MAQGNMLLGYARGSVGDVTFYRSKGAQKARARNRKPANPKTEKQVIQRAYFANAVRFFKQCNAGFFKFAYEDRKPNETDYNAFMRHNTKRAMMIGYTANRTVGYPAIGQWEVTQGSLHGFNLDTSTTPETDFAYSAGMAAPQSALTTVGELSQYLIEQGPNMWRAGDIITILGYSCTANSETSIEDLVPAAAPEATFSTFVRVVQFIVDTADTTPLNQIDPQGEWSLRSATTGDYWLHVEPDSDTMSNGIVMCALVQSRNISGGLLVSTAETYGNENAAAALVKAQSDEYKSEILADWQAAALAVLQGGASVPFQGAEIERIRVGFNDGYDEFNVDLLTSDRTAYTKQAVRSMYIEVRGKNLKKAPLTTDMVSSVTGATGVNVYKDWDTDELQMLQIEIAAPSQSWPNTHITVNFEYAGTTYAVQAWKGANINGISFGPNTLQDPPLAETWTNTTRRGYQMRFDEGFLEAGTDTTNWDLPPMILSDEIQIQNDPGGNPNIKAVTLTPTVWNESGTYQVRYCGKTILIVTVEST